MIINFRQGIVSLDTSIAPFTAATSPGGIDVTLNVGTQPFVVAVANQGQNYLWSESLTIDAWPSLSVSGTYWLYLDFNTNTFARTFGVSTLQPIVQANAPSLPAVNQHWYQTTTSQMFFWNGSTWSPTIRLFVARFVAPATFSSLSIAAPSYLGTTVGDTTPNSVTGRVVVDSSGYPIFKHDGTFFTTEDQTFAEGSAINGVRLESNVFTAQSASPSIIPVYEAVAFDTLGRVRIASYDDAGTTAIGLSLQQINFGGTGAICLEGTVTNPLWSFGNNVGALLWVSGTIPGTLQLTDPHADDPINFPIERVPVARVIGPTSIIFLQGIGTKGDPGPSGVANVPLATPTAPGLVYLSTDSNAFAPAVPPYAVTDGDPRLTDARAPLAHSQGATTINVTPYTSIPTGINFSGPTAQSALQQISDQALPVAGGTMTGLLNLSASPTNLSPTLQAATKGYVDSSISAIGSTYVPLAGGTMTGLLLLSANPISGLGAATKQYVDTADGLRLLLAGGTMTGIINMGSNKITNVTDPTSPQDAATKNYIDTITALPNLVIPYDMAFFLGGNMLYTNSISGAYLAPRTVTIPAGPSGLARCNTAPTAGVTYNIQKNGSTVGTVVFAGAATTGTVTISSLVTLISGDALTVVTPGVAEPNIKDVYITIVGTAVA